jgi:AcrR family transcriptional regulator
MSQRRVKITTMRARNASTTAPASFGVRGQRRQLVREALLETAKELFAERGYDNVTVAEIAAGAGVSVPTLFNYFPSKEDLLLAELDAVHLRFVTALRERDHDRSPLDAMTAWMLAELEKPPGDGLERFHRTVGTGVSVASLLRRLYEEWEDAIVEVLADEYNEARPTPRTRLIAALLVSFVRVMSSREVKDFVGDSGRADRSTALREWIAQTADLFGDGIRHRPTTVFLATPPPNRRAHDADGR